MPDTTIQPHTDVVLIGAGIMSATLGLMLKELQPDIRIQIFERLDHAAAESSDAWNNAGTGHSAFCELNYTPESKDGSVDISKALKIAESFEISRQFWSFLIEKGLVSNPEEFIRSIPHVSFVWGTDNVSFLRKRYEALQANPLFADMEFSTDHDVQKQWMPLVMEGRDPNEVNAATFMKIGTDVNFGALTRSMFNYLKEQPGISIFFNHEVRRLRQKDNGEWRITVRNLDTNEKSVTRTPFVFIGAGGGSLPLLEKAHIPEGNGFGGFPVSGQWLRCTNEEVIEKHFAKVYGKASVGAPPMSVPHIDSRMINGKKELLFGPYAGFSTKFLKNGSYLDLPLSIKANNVIPMLSAGFHNLPLTKYLIDQVRQSDDDRMDVLREYVPDAKSEDWILENAGQRVQVIKKDESGRGILEFGTEVVTKADGSLAVLLGASPGASTTASIMLDLLDRCFSEKHKSGEWQYKLRQMIPSYGVKLNDKPALLKEVRQRTASALKLEN
ncbi:malate:quinone oxidoreductase [Flavobacterium silvaticum]|uniref:Probable malate:quinone oxidoreductase n=1 Tax=Flavobacterium silvaticum TaxID=1852020 RepID=A0A972JKJ9_9FLAO|nr:malate:quinone oxidoreductase [Flavobacterium silvaticum]NMH29217.1 malate:quinone oxidoreductase [Flavobacterium silvaticum]